MQNSKRILKGSLVAGILIASTGFNSNATSRFDFNSLGNGNSLRSNLLKSETSSKTLELKCAAKKMADSSTMKGKDGKCGEGKCGASKKKSDSSSTKGKDGKCGADKKGM